MDATYRFPGLKNKAITFSFDDGVTQDKRLIEILDKYQLKCTFNINSELLGTPNYLDIRGKKIAHNKVQPHEVAELYKNHEVAVHTLTHIRLPGCEDDNEVIRQVEQDRLNLSKLVGYDVIGMAYPCGGVNNDERVARLIQNHTGVQYARTITTTNTFDFQDDLYRFNPTVHSFDKEARMEMAETFLNLSPEKPVLFYIWGHSYEFDIDDSWDEFEEFCKFISGREDVFYGTNKEVFGLGW